MRQVKRKQLRLEASERIHNDEVLVSESSLKNQDLIQDSNHTIMHNGAIKMSKMKTGAKIPIYDGPKMAQDKLIHKSLCSSIDIDVI